MILDVLMPDSIFSFLFFIFAVVEAVIVEIVEWKLPALRRRRQWGVKNHPADIMESAWPGPKRARK